MANVTEEGLLGEGYDLGASETLYGIECRYLDEAIAVGSQGTVLRTGDAGASWTAQDLGVTADLRALAAQEVGPVYIAGDGVFFTAVPDYATGAAEWRSLGDGVTRFRALAAAARAATVLAIADDGGLWSYESDQLVRRTTLAGARSVAVSPDGATVLVGGAGLLRSSDGGRTFSPLAVDSAFQFADVRVDNTGSGVAVGTGGAVALIDGEGRVLTQRIGASTLNTVYISPSEDYSGIGYTAGDDGQVWMTFDSGWSWTAGPNVGRTVFGVDEIGDGSR